MAPIMKTGRPHGSGKYPTRYTNPITGVVSSKSQYTDEHGVIRKIPSHHMEYKINDEWIKPGDVPENRDNVKKFLNTKKGFMLKILKGINKKDKKRREQGKFIQGESEFKDDRRGRCDTLMAHFDKQVERYGNKCPITHIPFTTSVAYQKFDINNYCSGVFSNVSPARIFNHIGYTIQNTIFTSYLWNYTKGDSPIWQLELVFQPEIVERYKAIVAERFPDQKYALQA